MRIGDASRALLGLALAPLVAGTVVVVGQPYLLDIGAGHVVSGPGWRSVSTMNSLAVPALVTGALVTLLAALPAHVVFHQRRWTRLRDYIALGALLGTAPFLLYLTFALPALWVNATGRPREWDVLGRLARLMTLGAIAGAVAAATFWTIAVRSRSAREIENSDVGTGNS